ncbi:MAG: RNA-binding S4 domain-containing protein [Candidatus Latescibacteria bacterium]|nr:RNA-binding S4 domain-containing protein [Candidatus Latescibacterota bacterium]
MSRLDLYLKNTGLFRQRSAARQACDAGQVWVAGQPAKASREVRAGEVLRLSLPDSELEAEIIAVPQHPVSKRDRPRYFRVIRTESRSPVEQAFGFDEEPHY